jgi:hypothetical protein
MSTVGRQGYLVAAVAGLAVGTASAQVPITVVSGFNLNSWNAGTAPPNFANWTPEKPSTGFANGLRWTWQNTDIDGNPVPATVHPVADPTVPGITGAFKFPDARAASIDLPAGTLRSWEDQAQPGEAATFEIWFKADDLDGSHVLWEIGATNKGVAFALDGNELVYSVQATDGPIGDPGTNATNYVHRQALADTEWHQAVITIDFFSFRITSYLDGQVVNSELIPASAGYRWTGGNPAGLGTLGTDPLFPASGIANDAVDQSSLTDYNGLISTMRFYDVDLFSNEVLDNYNALTDSAAAVRRGDYNGDDAADNNDAFDFITFMTATNTDAVTPFEYPFPHEPAPGVMTADPALDETFVGDFAWDRDKGWLAGSSEPTFQFPAVNVLDPVPVLEPAFPSIRTAFVLDGVEAFRGPKFEFADDSTAGHALFWLYVDDLVGNHCLFEAGGSGVGFSMVTRDDEIAGFINTAATDGLDILEVTSGPGVLQTGWHRFDVIVRRFAGSGIGQGFELYMDGQQVAAVNDQPGPDGEFGTADDVDVFNPEGPANTNFIGGNQGALGQVFGTAALPFGWDATSVTPFNGMAGPFRYIQGQPLPADLAAGFAADMDQNIVNDRGDVNRDGAANFLDVIDQLRLIDAGN